MKFRYILIWCILSAGCYVERHAEKEIIGKGANTPSSIVTSRFSQDPLADAKGFGFSISLPDSLLNKGWFFRGIRRDRTEPWWHTTPHILTRERFTFAVCDPYLRRHQFGRLIVNVYDADSSWMSVSDVVEKLGDGFHIADQTINSIPTKILRPQHTKRFPDMTLTVFF